MFTSHHITSHHVMSHHITSRHVTSYHITSHHICLVLTLQKAYGESTIQIATTERKFYFRAASTEEVIVRCTVLYCNSTTILSLLMYSVSIFVRVYEVESVDFFNLPLHCPCVSLSIICDSAYTTLYLNLRAAATIYIFLSLS